MIDLLKIDVGGAEWRVLNGLGSMLGAGQIGMVQFEFGMASLVLAHRALRDFLQMLEAINFRVGKLMPRGVEFGQYEPRREMQWANIVAVHEGRPDTLSILSTPP